MSVRETRKHWLYALPMIALIMLVVTVMLVGSGGSASAKVPTEPSNTTNGTDVTAAQSSKIQAAVLQDTSNGKSAPFIVVLASQADVSSAATMRDHDARGWYVYNTLKAHAERSQASIRAFLQATGVSYQSFWAANMLLVKGGDRALVEEIADRDDVRAIESNRPVKGIEEPNIANYLPADLPAIPAVAEWGVQRVNAPQVWAMGFTGQGIVIGIADSGMRWTHNALKPSYRGWDGATADHNYDWWDAVHDSTGNPCGNNSQFPCDDNGHGTHVTGTTTGDDLGANQIGVAPGAKWIGCRNLAANFGSPTRHTECFQFFIAPTDLAGQNANPALRPHVLNNSWVCTEPEGCAAETLQTIVENTQAAGIFINAGAGNSGPACGTIFNPPAIYEASFTIGAIDINNAIAGFSSRGPVTRDGSNRLKPNITAPGVNVRSANGLSNSGYVRSSGTSMSGPHVVGVVALLWSARPQLERDIVATKNILQNTANPDVIVSPVETCGGIPSSQIPNNTFGYGRVDALAAVNSVAQGTSTPTVTGTPPTATLTPTARPTPPCGTTVAGALTTTDPTESQRLFRALPASECDTPKACPGPSGTGPFYYRTFTYSNSTGAPACVTIELDPLTCNGTTNTFLHSSVYLNAFDPTNLCTNYLGDQGTSYTMPVPYSVTVPAGATFVIVVNAVTASATCPAYTLTVTGFVSCPTATATVMPTNTAIPPTQTRTSTAIPPTAISTSTAVQSAVTGTNTAVAPTATSTRTNTSIPPIATSTSVPATPTFTACPVQFSDVPEGSTFYTFVRCLACRGVLGGYSDGTFRPGNDVTRGQLAKIVSNAAGWNEPVAGQTFSDVAPGSTFYEYIERAAAHGAVGGYSDGTFRPGNNATRGQISKVVSNAMGWSEPVAGQTFSDVPVGSTFYEYIERMASRGVIGGYSDGTFRPNNNATRGQTAKIVSNAFFPGCQMPARK